MLFCKYFRTIQRSLEKGEKYLDINAFFVDIDRNSQHSESHLHTTTVTLVQQNHSLENSETTNINIIIFNLK